MKRLAFFFCLALLFACDDGTTEVTQVVQSNMKVVAEVSDLPDCTKDNEGEQTFVKKENAYRICVDNKWTVTDGDTVYINSLDVSCSTELLKDSSGVKIVCNGDSIGVVLNGIKGETGNPGKTGLGCNFVGRTDTSVTIACGDSSMTFSFGPSKVKDSNNVEPPLDSEAIAISLDSLTGYSQKGPFIKGSTVYLYELENGYTLKQTNGNFVSYITRDDGRYKFTARNLVSQYVMLMVDGNYRNEVTGEVSKNPIQLKVISNMRLHKTANVNLLTHLEFERVYHLVTKDKLTVLQAKRKAQKEVLSLFNIELDEKTDAEDMDVFGKSDADAALLAISILLQGARTEADLVALLTEISNGIADDGVWKGERADSIRVEMADWAFGRNLAKFRKNVEGWGLSDSVGNFEKYINHFIAKIYGINVCSEVSTELQMVDNEKSRFNGRTYQCYQGTESNEVTWVDVRPKSEYLNPDLEYGTMIDWRDRRMYYVRHVNESYIPYGLEGTPGLYPKIDETFMAENLDFEYRVDGKKYGMLCGINDCDLQERKLIGSHYTWGAAMDSAGLFSNDGIGCGFDRTCSATIPPRGICPEGWHIPDSKDWANLIEYAGYKMGEKDPARALLSQKSSSGGKNGLDKIGFSAIITAEWYGYDIVGVYSLKKFEYYAAFWSPDELSGEGAGIVGVGGRIGVYNAVNASAEYISGNFEYGNMKTSQINIRCFKDKEMNPLFEGVK